MCVLHSYHVQFAHIPCICMKFNHLWYRHDTCIHILFSVKIYAVHAYYFVLDMENVVVGMGTRQNRFNAEMKYVDYDFFYDWLLIKNLNWLVVFDQDCKCS